MAKSKKLQNDRHLIAAEELSLEDWLSYIRVPESSRDYLIADYCFPTDIHRDEYLASVHELSDIEVKNVLRRFLMSSGFLGNEALQIRIQAAYHGKNLSDQIEKYEYFRRLFSFKGAWEGITWVLDLLPDHPAEAIDVLWSYFTAHASFLPDGRISGLADAEAIIRQKYFHQTNSRDVLLTLRPADFEFLIASLYKEIGYRVSVSKVGADGGVDVIATKTESGEAEEVLIQCKRYAENVGVKTIRELMGVVSARHANKGVIVSASNFTKQAKIEAKATRRIELIGFNELNVLLNKYLGARWPLFMLHNIRLMKTSIDPAVI